MVVYSEVWAIDTEWGYRGGRLDHESAWEPVVFCAVGLRSGLRLHFWGRDGRLSKFIRDHGGDLFVAHYAVAEMKYLLRLGIQLPTNWFDTFVAWRYMANSPGNLEAGLSVALHRLGLPHLVPVTKDELRQRIAELRFDSDSPADREKIIEYCFSDCDGCRELFSRTSGWVSPTKMSHWSDFQKAIARMELRGLPMDVAAHGVICRNREGIRDALIAEVNRTWPVFQGGVFTKASFLEWCHTQGITWPKKFSEKRGVKYHPFDRDTRSAMQGHHPFIAQLHEVMKTLDVFKKWSLVVDPVTSQHYFNSSVFRTVSGRNQPRNFVFSGPKWQRLLLTPESPNHVLVYVDYTAQEIGLAAALSSDVNMRSVYEASDCHMAFAIRAGAAPAGATKSTHPTIRKQYKTVNLGVQYGQTAYGIAPKIGITHAAAEALLNEHKRLFPKFWLWSEKIVQGSFDRGYIVTPCGWRSRVPFNSNERTWMNWPMQSAGGDVMRFTITYLDRQNVRILAPVHDGFVLSCRRDQLDDLRSAVDYACHAAVEHVVPGFPMRWDFTVYEDRFEDDDGLPLWNQLKSLLRDLGIE